MRVLVIKISSMGDLIHTLPALTDATLAFPKVKFDWVADPVFADIPTWHPAVNRVIPAPIRQWKKNKWQALSQGKLKAFKQNLQQTKYDLIIDAQSALKTAILSTFARGSRAGMDHHSVREYGAHFFYQHKYFVDKNQHAIARLRELFAQAMGYTTPATPPNFGIDTTRLPTPSVVLPEKYIVCVHATTWKTKHWQTPHWQKLIALINQNGYEALLPWGNEAERQNALALANNNPNAQVLPKLSISECAAVIARASGVVAVDTGLGHISAALQTPAVHLYGPTDPKKIGAFGPRQFLLASDFNCAPCYKKLCSHNSSTQQESACLGAISPDDAWASLQKML